MSCTKQGLRMWKKGGNEMKWISEKRKANTDTAGGKGGGWGQNVCGCIEQRTDRCSKLTKHTKTKHIKYTAQSTPFPPGWSTMHWANIETRDRLTNTGGDRVGTQPCWIAPSVAKVIVSPSKPACSERPLAPRTPLTNPLLSGQKAVSVGSPCWRSGYLSQNHT